MVYVVLLACVVVCSAVFHNVFYAVGCYVAVWTDIRHGIIQNLLITQKGWVMPTTESGQMDSVFTGEGGLGRVDIWGSCMQQFVVI